MIQEKISYKNKRNASGSSPRLAKRIHFVGIGGIGMSGIASIMMKQGYRVSGSDIKESLITRKLSSLGIRVCLGHDASYISDAELLVYSSAVKEDNPELQAAKAKGLRILKRAQVLAQLMQDKACIAISGAHGKTTTCALTGHLLLQAGFSPTVAIGGILRNIGDNSCLGESNFFVAEADESDGTFLCYHPDYSIVTNIDREHLDFYKDWQDILSAYKKFISQTRDGGCLFCCGDDPAIRSITREYKKRMLYFGLSGENDFYPRNLLLDEFSCIFDCYYRDGFIARMHLPLAGRHNISNSLAVIALGLELGIKPQRIEESLAVFKGTERRFQLKAEVGGIKVIDDYAHHPTELRVTLEAAKNVRHKRLLVVFQPHRFSRTRFLMQEFAESLSLADCIILTDIYAASEEPIEGVSSEVLCDKIKEKHPLAEVIYVKKEKLIEQLLSIVRQGDLVLTVGAGDIGKLSDELAQRIKSQDTF